MSEDELDRAGIRDPRLRAAYTRCEEILRTDNHAAHTWMRDQLRPGERPFWDAVIAFCGHADDLTDAPGTTLAERRHRYDEFTRSFFRLLEEGPAAWDPGPGAGTAASRREGHLVSVAFAHFARLRRLDRDGIRQAGRALRADMEVTSYATVRDLEAHMHGISGQPACWIATLLDPAGRLPDAGARHTMISWSYGLQTLDFLVDVEEDLAAGKLYFPLQDLHHCGVRRSDLTEAVAARRTTPALRAVVRRQLARTKRYFTEAETWLATHRPAGWDPVHSSLAEARRTVGRIEASDGDVFAAGAAKG